MNHQASLVKAHRFFVGLLAAMFVLALALAGINNTWGAAFGYGLPLFLAPFALTVLKPAGLLSRAAVAVALILFCGLHIHQAGGMTELHFGIFVALSFLLLYKDWRVIVIAAITAALHHVWFNYLQSSGYDAYCFTRPSWSMVALHGLYVVASAALLCYIANQLADQTGEHDSDQDSAQRTLDELRAALEKARGGIEGINTAAQEIALVDARDDFEGFGAPRTDQSEDTGDLALEDREGIVAHHAAHGNVPDRQDLAAALADILRFTPAVIDFASKRTPHHGADHLVPVKSGRRAGFDQLPVA